MSAEAKRIAELEKALVLSQECLKRVKGTLKRTGHGFSAESLDGFIKMISNVLRRKRPKRRLH